MHAEVEDLIQRIHDAPAQAVLHVAGGGVSALAWLQTVPGASRTLLKATNPYHPSALADLLGYAPDQAVSAETALVMAERAYHEARKLAGQDVPLIGLGCTATLATDRPKRGQHRCHIAFVTEKEAKHYSLVLTKGLRTREDEDEVVSLLLLRALAEASEVEANQDPSTSSGLALGLEGEEEVRAEAVPQIPGLRAFLAGEGDLLTIPPVGPPQPQAPQARGVLSGSFNPLHEGHRRLAEAAARITGGDVAYELPVMNADKPALTEIQVRHRAMQFTGWATLVLTRAPTFAQKGEVLPGRIFILGVDTAERVLDPRFYGGTIQGVRAALDGVRAAGCRFLVAGRKEEERFVTLRDLDIPEGLADLFQEIPASEFRMDVSSTELRRSS